MHGNAETRCELAVFHWNFISSINAQSCNPQVKNWFQATNMIETGSKHTIQL